MNVIDVTQLVRNSPIPLVEGTRVMLTVNHKGGTCDIWLALLKGACVLCERGVITVDTTDPRVFEEYYTGDPVEDGLRFVESITSLSFAPKWGRGNELSGIYGLFQYDSPYFLTSSVPVWLARPGAFRIPYIMELLSLTKTHMATVFAMLPESAAIDFKT